MISFLFSMAGLLNLLFYVSRSLVYEFLEQPMGSRLFHLYQLELTSKLNKTAVQERCSHYLDAKESVLAFASVCRQFGPNRVEHWGQ